MDAADAVNPKSQAPNRKQRSAAFRIREDESDARAHRTPEALRAKPMKRPLSVSRQLWECVRVLAPLLRNVPD